MSITYRTIGRSGLAVSPLAIGTAAFGKANRIAGGQAGVDAIVHRSLESGLNFFDTADVYGDAPGASESLLGAALRGRRDEAVISTKFGSDLRGANGPDWGRRGSRRYIRIAVEASLRRLQTDWIDLYQIHSPDPVTPIEETLSVLDDLVREGKIRYAGHSNFAGWQITDAEHLARRDGRIPFISAQNEYNLLLRQPEKEILPATRSYGLGFLAYFPLQNGLLTGKYRRDFAPPEGKVTRFKAHLLRDAPWEALERFGAFAAERGISQVHLAYGWLLAQPGVTSLVTGVTDTDQLAANVAALDWTPTREELRELSDIFPGSLSGKPGKATA